MDNFVRPQLTLSNLNDAGFSFKRIARIIEPNADRI